ncbi:hypothetical protein JXB27_04285 [Candidatus Woesearchaeota archaeon]|nr:hypothetical protein [Candidatus Woesearchaeota archaeon]
MKDGVVKGFSFGLTSGVITTLGLMVGLNSATSSKLAVAGGILSIAFADAFSDALGIHISEEADKKATAKQIWTATNSTFFAKLFFALTFLIPVIFFSLNTAVLISVVWGLFLITWISYKIARMKREKPFSVINEHVLITILVIAVTYLVGNFVKFYFV